MAIIICDIDGTLLNGSSPIKKTADWLNAKSASYDIYIVTGRTTAERERTTSALREAGIKYDRLVMNNLGGDNSIEFKRGVAKRYASKAVLAIDNNERARAAYEAAGIRSVSPSNLPSSLSKTGIFEGVFDA